MSVENSIDFSQNWLKLKQEIDSEKEKKMTEDGFTVVQSKKKKLKRKFEENVQVQKSGGSENESNPGPSEVNEIKAKKMKKEVIQVKGREERNVKNKSETAEITKILAIDCEYVGTGIDGKTDSLARVSIVNADGKCIYDKYVAQTEPVTDYRTEVSGIRPGHLINGVQFTKVQQEVHKLLADRIVVGHALHNDFRVNVQSSDVQSDNDKRVLNLTHPRKLTRDSAKYKPLRALANSHRMPSLKYLAKEILGIQIQQGEHDSITDARIALRLYLMYKKKWDSEMQKYR